MPLNRSTLRLRLLDLLIAIFWIYLLFDAYAQGRDLPELIADLDLPALPVVLAAFAIVVIATLCGVVTFWQRRNIMQGMPVLSSAVDRIFGDAAYRHFTLHLRPVSASVVSSLILTLAGFHATFQTTRDAWSYAVCFGFLAFALCMFVAFLVSKRFPPKLRQALADPRQSAGAFQPGRDVRNSPQYTADVFVSSPPTGPMGQYPAPGSRVLL